LNAASNFLRDLVISVLHRLRQSRTLHTLTFGPISGVHFNQQSKKRFDFASMTLAVRGSRNLKRDYPTEQPVRLRSSHAL
jgi:hypothetical protein